MSVKIIILGSQAEAIPVRVKGPELTKFLEY